MFPLFIEHEGFRARVSRPDGCVTALVVLHKAVSHLVSSSDSHVSLTFDGTMSLCRYRIYIQLCSYALSEYSTVINIPHRNI